VDLCAEGATEEVTADEKAQDRQDLIDLVESRGWKLFTAHVAEQCSDAAVLRAMDALIAKQTDDATISVELRRLRAVHAATKGLLEWPAQHAEALKPVMVGVFDQFRRIGAGRQEQWR
jgi:hypothetical protein